MTSKTVPGVPSNPYIRCAYLEEPVLRFAGGRDHIDPKLGISCFGPKSYDPLKGHPQTVRVGIVGSAETIDKAQKWVTETARGVLGDKDHLEFPGFMEDRGYFSTLSFENDWLAQLSHAEISNVLGVAPKQDRFRVTIQLLESKLALLSEKDRQPEYIIIALPDDLYNKCRAVDYYHPALGYVHRDLRRAVKAIAMNYRIPTQLLRMGTTENDSSRTLGGHLKKSHPSDIAWNFFTGLYFKAGGSPWGPTGLIAGTCYIGISFYRPLGSISKTIQTALVQAFDEHGDGLVLRGHEFAWDSAREGTKSPHLTEEQAAALIDMVLSRYEKEMGQTPQRVVVHKTSRYWPTEEKGFSQALQKRVKKYDLMALAPQNQARLMPENLYPPLRGTHFSVCNIDYLYTTGYVASLNQFLGMHVPSPIQIADHIGGDTPRDTLLKEILILTKMNWNSSRLGGLLPITLKFSRLVGDIMREIPSDREPLTNFKYYM